MAKVESPFKSPQESCNDILQVLRDSNLNFLVTESPYSIQICLRKRFLKDAPKLKKADTTCDNILSTKIQTLEEDFKALETENVYLHDTIEETRKALEASKDINNILHSRIEAAEKDLYKHFEEGKKIELKQKEIKKKCDEENSKLQLELKYLNKSIKSKDKEIYDLSKKFDNVSETVKNLKSERTQLKTEKAKVESEVRKLEKRLNKKATYTETETCKVEKDLNSKDLNHNTLIFANVNTTKLKPVMLDSSSITQSSNNLSSTSGVSLASKKSLNVSTIEHPLNSSPQTPALQSNSNPVTYTSYYTADITTYPSMVTHWIAPAKQNAFDDPEYRKEFLRMFSEMVEMNTLKMIENISS